MERGTGIILVRDVCGLQELAIIKLENKRDREIGFVGCGCVGKFYEMFEVRSLGC